MSLQRPQKSGDRRKQPLLQSDECKFCICRVSRRKESDALGPKLAMGGEHLRQPKLGGGLRETVEQIGSMTRFGKDRGSIRRRSDLSRRTTTGSRSRGRIGTPRVKRCRSSISSNAEKLFECPLCGVAVRKSRCSNRSAKSGRALVNWLSIA